MAKFAPTGQTVAEVIESLPFENKKADAYELLALYERVSGEDAVVWYPNIIGFGQYHYVYDTGHEGDATLLAFSPRKAKISLYLDQDFPEREGLLDKLGKIKKAKGCAYVNKLADINMSFLEELLEKSLAYTKAKYDVK
ncbi:DUF1801 domain-containing protein [Globicatella sanguinis]|uniref:DUF1801 domain-containing protein n=1 Tax=Globicatella sanguinis TaxID=13076 RepID=UPI002542CB74|nr:DUF1801 domain-containing protein [Globicatella sanguinis]MDK7631467.1 DUF1801 domain-containing protein [Globicatella sanguinis]WIK67067.1 DUF1801 domain-containing protein [Globicatella sanguinis]WKT56472.1 DUF1801 domain-containing protein [Globicatella sanguinis]